MYTTVTDGKIFGSGTECVFVVQYLTRLLSARRRKRSSTSTIPSTTNTVKRNGKHCLLSV